MLEPTPIHPTQEQIDADHARLLAPRQVHRTFWSWFDRQRCRDDAVGQLARDVYRDPARGDRSLTVLSLALFLRDQYSADGDLDAVMAAHAQAEYQYNTYMHARTVNTVWFIYRGVRPIQHQLVTVVLDEESVARVIDACCAMDPSTTYSSVLHSRDTVRCATGEHEWWQSLDANRCCTVHWDPVAVFPDRPLPASYDDTRGVVTMPDGWRIVWVPRD